MPLWLQLIILLCVVGLTLALLRHYWHKKQLAKRLQLLERLFANSQAYKLSLAERKQSHNPDAELIYGEMNVHTMFDIMAVVKPQPAERFIDLGSGSGLVVLTVAMQYPMAGYHGVELLPSLQQYSLEQTRALLASSQCPSHIMSEAVHFFNDDYYHFDFSDYDIVYINAVAVGKKHWRQLTEKLQQLAAGSRVITVSKQLPAHSFELLDGGMRMMSWGYNSIYIYQKKPSEVQ